LLTGSIAQNYKDNHDSYDDIISTNGSRVTGKAVKTVILEGSLLTNNHFNAVRTTSSTVFSLWSIQPIEQISCFQ